MKELINEENPANYRGVLLEGLKTSKKASKLISTGWGYQANQIQVYFVISNYEADKTIVLN